MYRFLDSKPNSGEFNNQGMKENRAFKSYSLSPPKSNKKIDRFSKIFSSNHNTSVQILNLLFQNQHLFLLLFTFQRGTNDPLAQDEKMVNGRSVRYHPILSRLTPRMHTLIFL